MKNNPILYVVPIVDTEGPAFDPPLGLYNNWKQVEKNFLDLSSESFRDKFKDSFGKPVKINWFILDWVGFLANPVKREFGYHKIFDKYKEWVKTANNRDGIYWHYHHPSMNGVGNVWNTNWLLSPKHIVGYEYNNILARKIIERQWFSNVFRAGGAIEDNNCSLWLEKNFPIDYSNRSPFKIENLLDWSKAPQEWNFYHPSQKDYQAQGNMKRYVVRCKDALFKQFQINRDDILQAFDEATKRGYAILSFFLHDYRDMKSNFERVFAMIEELRNQFPDVLVKNSLADETIFSIENIEPSPLKFKIAERGKNSATIKISNEIFGDLPFVAVKSRNGIELIFSVRKIGDSEYEIHKLPENIEILGIAANGKDLRPYVKTFEF